MTVTQIDPKYFKSVEVEPGDFKSFDAAVKKFRKVVEKNGNLQIAVDRIKGYKKPSEKRNDKKRRAKFFRGRQQDRPRRRVGSICITSMSD